MVDFEVQRCTRRCAETDEEFKAGEEFYSVLVSEGAEVVRRDYASSVWKGPPDANLGWWKSQMPDINQRKLHWAPNDVMLHYFEQLDREPDKVHTRYILTLLMIRRRILKLVETEQDDQGREILVVYCSKNENEYRILVAQPTPELAGQIQTELAKLLFAKGS